MLALWRRFRAFDARVNDSWIGDLICAFALMLLIPVLSFLSLILGG